MGDTSGNLLGQLRAADRERYLSVLFAPEDKREALAALFLFNAEIARIRDIVSEPLPGEIRLQWWREVIDGDRAEEAGHHPVAAPLLKTINRFDLPAATFDNMLEARIFDLYDDPMPARTDLEGYLGETGSALIQMACQILNGGAVPPTADPAGHAGVAYGIANLIRQMPVHRARGQVYLPGDLLSAAGFDASHWLAGDDDDAAATATSAFVALGRQHLRQARNALASVDRTLRPPFSVLGVADAVFDAAERAGAGASTRPVTISPVRAQWRITRFALSR
ncbi:MULTISPECIES: phytoene/squalene synthase family protein [unclassified Roseitalea]|uniref:phytoene/squalene synthase family protein n=1 Tax=unclassified Roseitalea TaxID=2639107 RepID=UPI00273E8E15|nr:MULTISPECIES: phytoene/squalene synthase family protein [unclassified Roseitalea]